MGKLVLIAALMVGCNGCADDEPGKLPMCTDLGAPAGASLFCTQTGVCSWDGAECCGDGGSDARCPDEQTK